MQKTMKAAVWQEKGRVVLEDRPVPTIQEQTDAIVRVTRSSICSSDLHIIHGTVPRARENVILGHEFTGEIIETGTGVKRFRVTAYPSMWKPSAGNVISARGAM